MRGVLYEDPVSQKGWEFHSEDMDSVKEIRRPESHRVVIEQKDGETEIPWNRVYKYGKLEVVGLDN